MSVLGCEDDKKHCDATKMHQVDKGGKRQYSKMPCDGMGHGTLAQTFLGGVAAAV